jgi:Magnesium transporter NIPA
MATEFPLWVLGVVLIIFGSVGNNLGNNLVSLAHKVRKDRELDISAIDDCEGVKELPQATILEKTESAEGVQVMVEERPKKREWSLRAIGTFIFVFGNLFTFAAFGFGAQSLLASLESVQFVSNIVFAKYVHKERITVRMILATASIVLGNILVVIFSDHTVRLYTSGDMIYLFRNNTDYHSYLAVAGFLWVASHVTYTQYHKIRMKERRLLYRHSFIEPLAFTVSSAIIGTQAVLLSKCMSMLIQVSAMGDNEFRKPTIYVVLVGWLVLVSYWVRRLDLGLSLYPPLFVIPAMQVFFVFFAIISGGVYFEEFRGFDSMHFGGFFCGVVMILLGVCGLAPTDGLLPPHSLEETPVLPTFMLSTDTSTPMSCSDKDRDRDRNIECALGSADYGKGEQAKGKGNGSDVKRCYIAADHSTKNVVGSSHDISTTPTGCKPHHQPPTTTAGELQVLSPPSDPLSILDGGKILLAGKSSSTREDNLAEKRKRRKVVKRPAPIQHSHKIHAHDGSV